MKDDYEIKQAIDDAVNAAMKKYGFVNAVSSLKTFRDKSMFYQCDLDLMSPEEILAVKAKEEKV